VAFSVRIEVLKFPSKASMLWLEPNWWNPEDLKRDSRFEYSNETGSYSDYTACLSKAEFLALLNRYRPAVEKLPNDDKRSRAELVILDNVLELIDEKYDMIKVTAYEWESGHG